MIASRPVFFLGHMGLTLVEIGVTYYKASWADCK